MKDLDKKFEDLTYLVTNFQLEFEKKLIISAKNLTTSLLKHFFRVFNRVEQFCFFGEKMTS